MANRNNDSKKMFHSMEQLKVELFPNMPLETDDEIELPGKKATDEAESLAEKLIHDLMTTPKKQER